MTDQQSDFKIYRANAIPPKAAPVLIVEVWGASHQFLVQYFLWQDDAKGVIQKFSYPNFPAFQLDLGFGFKETLQRVEGQLNNQLFEERSPTASCPSCPLYSFEEAGAPELYRLQQRGDGAYAALRNNATCPQLLDLLEAGGALERLRHLSTAGLL